MSKGRAFTLVELLVVIGIIGLLIAILLPVLSQVRDAARSVACQANQREIAKTAMSWASDHDGHLPLDGQIHIPADAATAWGLPSALNDTARRKYAYTLDDGSYWGSNIPPTLESPTPFLSALFQSIVVDGDAVVKPSMYWTRDIDPVYRETVTFHCPSADRKYQWENVWLRDGMESMIFMIGDTDYGAPWATSFDYSTNGGLLGFLSDQDQGHRAYRGRLSAVRDSARMVLIGDGDGDFMSWVPKADHAATRMTLADVWTRSDQTFVAWWAVHRPQMDPSRHRGRVNVAFVDGHVEAVEANASALGKCNLLLGSND